MAQEQVHRRLAAILAADVVGYSTLMEHAEEATYAHFEQLKREVIGPSLFRCQGRLIRTTGDGALAEFASPSAAVNCAVEIQNSIASGSSDLRLRIGVNLGELIVGSDGDLFGDGINIAVRLEGIADPGGILISAKVHEEVEGKVDFTFEERGERHLKNISRPVRTYAVLLKREERSIPAAYSTVSPPLALPEKPSLAVLPFQNLSGDPEQEYFADGMVEEIITGLSRSKQLFVIARNSTFTYKGKAVDVARVGRELGVRYVLEGSVRKAGGRVRITGQLIEAATRIHIWADRFDGFIQDVFDLQDKIAASVVGAISPAIERAEILLADRKPTHSLGAYDHYLRGLASLYEYNEDGHKRAGPLFVRATENDPKFALAYAAQATWYTTGKSWGWIKIAEQDVRRVEELAHRALALNDNDPRVFAHAGQALLFVVGQLEEGASALSRAVQIDPNLAVARVWLGGANNYLGKYEQGIEELELALRLSPLDPRTFLVYVNLAASHFFAGRYEEAWRWASTGLRSWPHFPRLHWHAMQALAMLGRLDEAAKARERVLQLNPGLTISEFRKSAPYLKEEASEKVAAAWRLAGMPE